MKHFILGSVGGFAYIVTELLWRGWTHWSMFILGGACFVAVGEISRKLRHMPLTVKILTGAACITALEFLTGYIVNIALHMRVWSYSNMPLNVMGQICLPYSALWLLLTPICIFAYTRLDDAVQL